MSNPMSDINNALIENTSSEWNHYSIYWRGDEAHMTDGKHSVFIGYLHEGEETLVNRLEMCENALDNWQF